MQKGGLSRGVTVKLDKNTYKGIKDTLEITLQTHNKKLVCGEFDRLNGIPAYAGVIEQKRKLAKFVLNRAIYPI